MLSFCENFRRQFVHLYRDRKPLLLNPLNESGIEVIRAEVYVLFRPILLKIEYLPELYYPVAAGRNAN